MNSRLMPDQTDAHPHRWPSAGRAAERCRRHKMASVASARPISLRHKPSPSHAKSSQRPLCASFRSHPHRTITAPHRSRQASIPIAPAAPPAISSRDFVPWRFSDAGRTHAPLDLQSGVRETCTSTVIRPLAINWWGEYPQVTPWTAQRYGRKRRSGRWAYTLYDVRPHACASIFHPSPCFENVYARVPFRTAV